MATNLSEPKNLPLTSGDFSFYDTVPNDRLLLNDFTDGDKFNADKFMEFVLRYINTGDSDVRSEFVAGMENALWEKMRAAIHEISSLDTGDPTLKEQLEYITEYEFPARSMKGSATADYSYTETSDGNEDSFLHKTVHSTSASGSFEFRQPLGRNWILNLDGSALGRVNRETQIEKVEGETDSSQSTYPGSQLYGNGGVQRRDDSFGLSFDAYHERYYNAPADHLRNSLLLSGFAALQNLRLGGNPFSVESNFIYMDNDYTAPPGTSDFMRRNADTIGTGFETTYKISPFGFVLNGSYSDNDTAGYYYARETNSLSSGTMLQYTGGDNYIRVGPGAGTWEQRYLSSGNSEPVNTNGMNVYGSAQGKVVIARHLSVEASAKILGNDSDGAFVGWYPGWQTNLNLVYSSAKLTAALIGQYSGNRIDLNEYQETHQVTGGIQMAYRPNNRWKIALQPNTTMDQVTGFQGYESRQGILTASVRHNVPAWDRLWLTAYGSGLISSYEDQTTQSKGQGWQAGGAVEVKY